MNPYPHKIAVLNFGGLGDEILFAPVLAILRATCPHASITLFLEDRSQSVVPLLPALHLTQGDRMVPLKVQGTGRAKLFASLWQQLAGKGYDAVLSSGSSPFIAAMLALTGIPVRVGFNTGASARLLLTAAGPLIKQQYAARMYYALAEAWVRAIGADPAVLDPDPVPRLRVPASERLEWAKALLGKAEDRQPKILIHPGVSQVSMQKGIFKAWEPVRWADCIRQLVPTAQVYLLGGPDDAEAVAQILGQLPTGLPGFSNLYGQTRNLQDLAALIATADLLVCVDSSPLHLAIGLNKPVVALFGPTDEKKLLPDLPNVKAVTMGNLPCRPCLWDHRQLNCETSDCLKIEVGLVLRTIQEVLDQCN